MRARAGQQIVPELPGDSEAAPNDSETTRQTSERPTASATPFQPLLAATLTCAGLSPPPSYLSHGVAAAAGDGEPKTSGWIMRASCSRPSTRRGPGRTRRLSSMTYTRPSWTALSPL